MQVRAPPAARRPKAAPALDWRGGPGAEIAVARRNEVAELRGRHVPRRLCSLVPKKREHTVPRRPSSTSAPDRACDASAPRETCARNAAIETPRARQDDRPSRRGLPLTAKAEPETSIVCTTPREGEVHAADRPFGPATPAWSRRAANARRRAGQEAHLGEHLKAVADPEDGRPALGERHDRVGDGREACDRTAAEVVAVREPARYDHELRVAERGLLVEHQARVPAHDVPRDLQRVPVRVAPRKLNDRGLHAHFSITFSRGEEVRRCGSGAFGTCVV